MRQTMELTDERLLMTKKALLISTRLFWPADDGRKVVLHHYCKGLREQLDFDVFVYSFLEGGQTYDESLKHPVFIKDVRVAKPVSGFTKAVNFCKLLFSRAMPLQCALFWSNENVRAIRSYCEEVRPDVVIIDMIRLAPYMMVVKSLNIPVVLDYDDLLSKRYARQIGKEAGNVLGKYGTQVSGFMSTLAENRTVKNAVLTVESGRVRRAEDDFARRADAVLFVSPIESKELDERLGTEKCFDATIGAAVLDESTEYAEKEYNLGFVGNMHTAANQAALDYICTEILPLLPSKTLRVVGVCPKEIQERYSLLEHVSFSGRVESISDELTKCEVMLAPFAYGTGIKTKILEAMGIGIPVVTNDFGVEGMTCRPGVEFELGNTPEALAKCCETLLLSQEKRREMARAAKDYIRRNHDWKNSIGNLGRCLDYAERERIGNSSMSGESR